MSIAPTPGVAPLTGPCAPARTDVDTHCSDAERLAQAAVAHQQRLRDVRRQLGEVAAIRDADARVRDRRQLDAAKVAAREAYHQALVHAGDQTDVHEAARVWLREVDRLNRQLSLADRRAEEVVRRVSELERSLPGIELAADAARIAAEAAHVACLDARRALAECEEQAQRRVLAAAAGQAAAAGRASHAGVGSSGSSGLASATSASSDSPRAATAPGAAVRPRGIRPISLVVRGDRETLLNLALRMADETGVEAGRLQLMLLELREGIAAQALAENAVRFPADHPFWSQFPADVGRQIARSLASMGYRFDGHDGWLDGRTPTTRELAMALAHVGLDPRTLKRPARQEAVDSLWSGTTVVVEEYLAARAPNLDLQHVMTCAGTRAARLSDLWDMWGRLRPLLLTPA